MSHIFASFGKAFHVDFICGRCCCSRMRFLPPPSLPKTVFRRIIICSMCVCRSMSTGERMCVCVCCAIYGLRLFACCAGIALVLARTLLLFYVLACFTFQLASFVRTEKLFNMPRTGHGGRVGGGTQKSVSVCVYNLLFLWQSTHTHTYTLAALSLCLSPASTRLKC